MKQIMMFNMFMWFCIALVAIAAIYISKNPKWAFLLFIGPFSTLTIKENEENDIRNKNEER